MSIKTLPEVRAMTDFPESPDGMRAYLNRSIRLATGKIWGLNNEETNVSEVEILAGPSGVWGKKVDEIEGPFAGEYDEQEYGNNIALCELNIRESLLILEALESGNTDKVLDVGSGTGRIALFLTAIGSREMTAFDQTLEYMRILRQKMVRIGNVPVLGETGRLRLATVPVETYLAEDGFGDPRPSFITSMFGVLNHTQDTFGSTAGLYDLLEPGGRFVASYYGSQRAAVFEELRTGLGYQPAILVRRVDGGLILGESGKFLPANFPSPAEIKEVLTERGAKVLKLAPYLFLTSLFPMKPNKKNITAYLDAVGRVAGTAAQNRLGRFAEDPNSLFWAACKYDRDEESKIDPDLGAYIGIAVEKSGDSL